MAYHVLMAVDLVEFHRVRSLVEEALKEAYADIPEAPIEIEPGHWLLWPARKVQAVIEETMMWFYGQPAGETGRLQVHITAPGGSDDRIRPRPARTPFGPGHAKEAGVSARQYSDTWGHHWGYDKPEVQLAWKLGYEAFEHADPVSKEALWSLREQATRMQARDPFHGAVDEVVAVSRAARPDEWKEIDKKITWRGHDLALQGLWHAMDDWRRGTFGYASEGVPFGVKEWRPPLES